MLCPQLAVPELFWLLQRQKTRLYIERSHIAFDRATATTDDTEFRLALHIYGNLVGLMTWGSIMTHMFHMLDNWSILYVGRIFKYSEFGWQLAKNFKVHWVSAGRISDLFLTSQTFISNTGLNHRSPAGQMHSDNLMASGFQATALLSSMSIYHIITPPCMQHKIASAVSLHASFSVND